MTFSSRKILYINLITRSFEIKTYPDLHAFLGGLALGLKIISLNKEKSPLVFSVGPLNGAFPFVSKTCILEYSTGLTELYLGGCLSSRIRFAGFDAVVIFGKSREPVFLEINPSEVNFLTPRNFSPEVGLPGRSAKLAFNGQFLVLNDYFYTRENRLAHFFENRNLAGIVVNATVSLDLKNSSVYNSLYNEILGRSNDLSVMPANNPSCSGCPLGCKESQVGETEGNVLVHSLVACKYASAIYSDLGIVFSCLNSLGYDYTHEELESIPGLVKDLLKELRK